MKIIIVISCVCFGVLLEANEERYPKVFNRRKRYVAFPEAASLSLAGCMTVGVLGQPVPKYGLFTWGVNWAISYPLPNSTEVTLMYLKKHRRKHVQQRRNRRDLYRKLEVILDNMGYDGRECILKTLCETYQRVALHGDNIVEEIFRLIFTFPATKVLSIEPLENVIYEASQRVGRIPDSCDRFNCPISLVDWMKGYYNAPSPTVDVDRSPWSLALSSLT